MKVVFITRIGDSDGLGHLGRCIAFANTFVQAGCEIEILVIKASDYFLPSDLDINNIDINIHVDISEEYLSKYIKNISPSIMIVDMHNPEKHYYKLAKDNNILSINMSVVGDSNYDSDILINPLADKNEDYPSCQVINNQLSYIYDISRFEDHSRPEIKYEYVMITLGGSSGLYQIYKQLIDSIINITNQHFVVYVKEDSALKKLKYTYSHADNILFINNKYSEYLSHAKYVICSFGTTLWESLAMSIPCYVIPIREQHFQHAYKLKADCYEIAELNYEQSFLRINEWLRDLHSNPESYKLICSKIDTYFNPKSIMTLCENIITLYNNRNANVQQHTI